MSLTVTGHREGDLPPGDVLLVCPWRRPLHSAVAGPSASVRSVFSGPVSWSLCFWRRWVLCAGQGHWGVGGGCFLGSHTLVWTPGSHLQLLTVPFLPPQALPSLSHLSHHTGAHMHALHPVASLSSWPNCIHPALRLEARFFSFFFYFK